MEGSLSSMDTRLFDQQDSPEDFLYLLAVYIWNKVDEIIDEMLSDTCLLKYRIDHYIIYTIF